MMKVTDFKEIVWDIECDGLNSPSNEVTTMWCISIRDINTGEPELFTDYDPTKRSIEDAVNIIFKADKWANHNIIGFDMEVLKKLGYNLPTPLPLVIDTLICSKVLYPTIQNFKFKGKVPRKISWSHSLEAWGHRLKENKGIYDDWSEYTPEMGEYCEQDTKVTYLMLKHLEARAESINVPWDFTCLPSPLAIEHKFKYLTTRQEKTGFPFDVAAARELVGPVLEEREELLDKLQETFPPVTETIHYETKVKKIKKVKEVTTVFNPGSRKQIGERLMSAGWQPGSFTVTGRPVVNEDTMSDAALLIPEAELIDRYLTLDKRLGQILNGDNAWLRLEKEGVVYGSVDTLGCVTFRVSHVRPNMSQVPSVGKYLGKECRNLFHAREGWILVGADLAGIELRCLGHYLHHWDGGEYIKHVLHGDVHTVHQQAFGLPPGDKWRSIGKSGTYCLIYGGGDWKLGRTLKDRGTKESVERAGKKFRASLMSSLPALAKLVAAIKKKRLAKSIYGKHFIRGLAGHPLYCRAAHSSINTLTQHAGAVVAKVWYILFHREMDELGYVYGRDYETYGFFHDEIQAGSRPGVEDTVGHVLCDTALKAGVLLGMRIPTEAEYKKGYTWLDTH